MGNEKGSWKEALGNSVDIIESMPRDKPRFVKSHLPLELLPKRLLTVKPKIVYVARNPKDMCVSYYHYCKLIHNLEGSFEEFCELFLANKAPYGPIWDHILGFWRLRNEPNVLFFKYEDMKKDHRQAIMHAAEFLNRKLTEEQITSLISHLSFDKMRENPALNLESFLKEKNGPNFESKNDNQMFIRKGQVGDWKNYMTSKLAEKFDRWTEENLKGMDLSFDNI